MLCKFFSQYILLVETNHPLIIVTSYAQNRVVIDQFGVVKITSSVVISYNCSGRFKRRC